MKIETKYDVGQKVWIAHKTTVYKPIFTCPVCKGTGNSIMKQCMPCDARLGFIYSCHNGQMCESLYQFNPQEATIRNVRIDIDPYVLDDTLIEYGLQEQACTYEENDIFLTYEDAQRWCDLTNEKQ